MKLQLLTIITSVIALSACNSTPSASADSATRQASLLDVEINAPVIDQPLKNVVPSTQVFTFENVKGLVQRTARHSVITVPANAFVAADGNPVTGKVSIAFQEIFNPAEIILSGIPMNVKKDDVTMPFISDGMFSIEASCEGQEVKLAEGKTVLVNTSSQKKNTDFDYWYLNEQSGEWENIGDRTSVLSEKQVIEKSRELNAEQTTIAFTPAPTTAAIQANLITSDQKGIAKPLQPKAHHPDDFVFNLAASYKDYPELAPFKNVLWKPVSKLTKTEQASLVTGMQTFGANVNLLCKDKDQQIYTISYGSESVDVCPVFIGADRKKAMEVYQAKMDTYQQKLKEEADQQKLAQKEQEQYMKSYNMFTVSRMGVYNCDRFYNNPNKNDYTFVSQNKPVEQHVFAILKDNEGVIALSSAYKQNDVYKLPGKEICGFIYTNTQGVVSYARQNASDVVRSNTVNLKIHEKLVESPEDLQAIIKSF